MMLDFVEMKLLLHLLLNGFFYFFILHFDLLYNMLLFFNVLESTPNVASNDGISVR
jgi:hypothetical protein